MLQLQWMDKFRNENILHLTDIPLFDNWLDEQIRSCFDLQIPAILSLLCKDNICPSITLRMKY